MKTNRFLPLAAVFAIALTFFACSNDSDLGGEPSSDSTGQGSSSSTGQQGGQVFCQLTESTCSQRSFSACMELVNAGMAEIVPNCDIQKNSSSSSSSDTQSSSSSAEQSSSSSQSSSSTGRLPCGTQTYNPTGQFCVNDGVYELCGGSNYNPATQFCQSNSIKNGWKNIKGEDFWYSPSNESWIFNNEVGSVILNSSGGVKFSAVSGSTEGYYLQLSQDSHNLRTGDCYIIGIYGKTSTSTRTIQLGLQQIGGSYTGYWAYDFILNSTYDGYDTYAYITGTDANARFYINAGYNSIGELTITDLVIKKLASSTNQSLCEDGYYDY